MFKELIYHTSKGKYKVTPNRASDIKVFMLCGVDTLTRNQAEETIEALCMLDYSGHYNSVDKTRGFDCEPFAGSPVMTFTDGSLQGYTIGNNVTEKGDLKYHIVRLLPDGTVRSLITQSDDEHIGVNMLQYNTSVSSADWQRLALNMYHIFDERIIDISDNQLRFLRMDIKIKVAYMLLAECYLTPSWAERIVLLPDINAMFGNDLILVHSILAELSAIRNLDTILCTEYYDMGTLAKKCEVKKIG